MMNKVRSRGRRPGGSDSREAILAAARSRFLSEGYQGATMRAIATDAGVDVALISYFFGSKRGVFGAAMALPVNPLDVLDGVLEGDLATLAERLLTALLLTWDEARTGDPLRELARAAVVDSDLASLVADAVGGEIISRLATRIGGCGASQRATVFISMTSGLILNRYLLGIEPLASMPREDVVRLLTPALRFTLGIAPAPTMNSTGGDPTQSSVHRHPSPSTSVSVNNSSHGTGSPPEPSAARMRRRVTRTRRTPG